MLIEDKIKIRTRSAQPKGTGESLALGSHEMCSMVAVMEKMLSRAFMSSGIKLVAMLLCLQFWDGGCDEVGSG
jgi:hypothetical protein